MGRDPVQRTFDQAARNYDNIKIQIIDHLENDIAETVEAQLAYLKTAGFKTHDLLWRHEKFAAFHACK